MGHGLETPLLQPAPPGSEPAYPSAPPLQTGAPLPAYPYVPAGYPAPPPLHIPPQPRIAAPPGYAAAGVPTSSQLPPLLVPPHAAPPTVHVSLHAAGGAPAPLTCPACLAVGRTVVRRESGCIAWLTSLALCFVCCPAFWVPFCLDCDRDLVHRCASCGTEVGRVRPWC